MFLPLFDREISREKNQDSQAMQSLVARIQGADVHAETELVNLFARSVHLVLRRHTRSQDDLEDLFQETFRIVLDKIHRGELRQPERLSGFIMNTARFASTQYYRNLGRFRPNQEPFQQKHRTNNPLHSLISRETCVKLHQAIPELKCARDRAILQRFYLAEEDKTAICQDLGISKNNFRQVLFRAKKRLKVLLLKDKTFSQNGE